MAIDQGETQATYPVSATALYFVLVSIVGAFLIVSCATSTPSYDDYTPRSKKAPSTGGVDLEEMRKRNLKRRDKARNEALPEGFQKMLAMPVEKRGNQKVNDFSAAKKISSSIFYKNPITFYCGCTYTPRKTGGVIDWDSCGYKARSNNTTRAERVEWEHIVPASAFGHSFEVWHKGDPKCQTSKGKSYKGRRCASRVSKVFSYMEADLYNLRPSVGEVNGDRSNKPYAEISGERGPYGDCDVEVTKKAMEPPPNVRGDIARTYLYMDWAYPNRGVLKDPSMRDMIEQWHEEDPLSEEEIKFGLLVAQLQGNANPWLVDWKAKTPQGNASRSQTQHVSHAILR